MPNDSEMPALEECKRRWKEQFYATAERKAERGWVRVEPIIREYLQGSRSVSEIAKRHNYGRTEAYYLLHKRLRLPKTANAGKLQAMASRLANTGNKDLTKSKLAACGCVVCLWILNRIKLIENNDVGY
jgi:hypothetical protein